MAHDEPTAAAQMAFDEGLVAEGIPTLRLFRWHTPAVSVGYRQRLPEWADPAALLSSGVELVERPTGGGIAVHGSDLSCAMVVPRHPSLRLRMVMEQTCETFAHVCRSVGVDVQWRVEMPRRSPVVYCLTEPSPYALTVKGRPSTSLTSCRVLRQAQDPSTKDPEQGRGTRHSVRGRMALSEPFDSASPRSGRVLSLSKHEQGESKGRKLCGFAIRAYAAAWLIQGSLLVQPLPDAIRAVMPESVRFDYDTRAICLEQAAGVAIGVRRLQEALTSCWGLTPEEGSRLKAKGSFGCRL